MSRTIGEATRGPQEAPSRDVIFRGWTTFGIATLSEVDGSRVRRAFEDHGVAACVLPYDPVRRVALVVRQRRVGPILAGEAADLLEAPAGGIETGEDPEVAARREALEEAGVRLQTLKPVGRPYSMPGISTERLFLYLATYGAADRVTQGGGIAAESEHIVVAEIPLSQLAAATAAGLTVDLKTIVLVLTLQLRRPDLFVPETPTGV